MAQQSKLPGNADQKRNSWSRGKGAYSMRGELKRGIALRKKYLNRRVRRRRDIPLKGCLYKRLNPTVKMMEFT